MFTHAQIWDAIDRLAQSHNLSTSGLAKAAGLDPTSFNKSKRLSPEGKERWPSTESVAKILAATGSSMSDFLSLIDQSNGTRKNGRPIPITKYRMAQEGTCFDAHGLPVAKFWEEFSFNVTEQIGDKNAYALELSNKEASKYFRAGDIIVVSPAAEMRVGDKVIFKMNDGRLLLSELTSKTARSIDIKSLDKDEASNQINISDISWMARILWASQ